MLFFFILTSVSANLDLAALEILQETNRMEPQLRPQLTLEEGMEDPIYSTKQIASQSPEGQVVDLKK